MKITKNVPAPVKAPPTTLTAEGILTETFWKNQGRGGASALRKSKQSVVFTLENGRVTSQKALSAQGEVGGPYTDSPNVPFPRDLDAQSLRNMALVASKLADLLEGVPE